MSLRHDNRSTVQRATPRPSRGSCATPYARRCPQKRTGCRPLKPHPPSDALTASRDWFALPHGLRGLANPQGSAVIVDECDHGLNGGQLRLDKVRGDVWGTPRVLPAPGPALKIRPQVDSLMEIAGAAGR
jgi:hypothetical protein